MKQRSIRFKMWTAFANLLLLAFILAAAGLYAVGLYKNLVRNVAWRANVLPIAGNLSAHVGELRTVLGELRGIRRTTRLRLSPLDGAEDRILLEGKFQKSLFEVKKAFNAYRQHLEERVQEVGHDDSFKQEFSTLRAIRRSVGEVDRAVASNEWGATDKTLEAIENRLTELQELSGTLPTYLHEELKGYSQTMKRQARWLNTIVLVCVTISAVLMILLIRLSYVWIFKPLGILIEGSRRVVGETVSGGTIQHRILLPTRDEMAELADSMNQMTERFEEIRHDLDRKVQQRSRELIRSERLASVGFLAAGLAHEINNPLAAISTCAESLQRRIVPALEREKPDDEESGLARRYLKMIQDEAFRCKGITEKLLSFARSEKKERERTDLSQLVVDIVEMTRQHDSFKQKEIRLDLPPTLEITANPQEMKQIVLNLLANALSCTAVDGSVTIRLRREADAAVLTIDDNGIGMDEATMRNIFEPFFTRREHGQGTGLGLSITHRIVEDHRGRIEAFSDGPGRGSTFVVELPLEND